MPYEITFGRNYYHILHDIEDWCRKNIGPGGYLVNDLCVWKIDTMFGNSTFAFKHEKHYTWFILRWGNDQEI